MRRAFRKYLLMTIPAVLLASHPAHAQPIGTRIGREATQADAPAVTARLANCIADDRPALVRKWFDTLPGTAAEHAVVAAETDKMSVCLDSRLLLMDGKGLAFSADKMRYPVAMATLRKILPKSPMSPPAPKHSTPWFAAAYAAETDKTKLDVNAIGLQDFGHCIATTDWANTRAFLLSTANSPEQAKALKPLIPVLGPCLPAGVTIKVNPDNLRMVLAEPVYHILSAPRLTNQGTAE